MEAADAFDAAPRLEAERDLARAAAATRRANGALCFASAGCRANVARLRTRERALLDVAKRHRDAHATRVRDAKKKLGLWSALGVAEAKALFKRAYESGKVYATRTSYYDTFWLILAGRSDDSLIELLLRWGLQVLANFTVGMTTAVLRFAWALPSLIASFGADTLSAAAFYGVAVVSAASVASSLLLLLFGTAGGVTYGVVAAAPALARLEQSLAGAEAAAYEGLRRHVYAGFRPFEDSVRWVGAGTDLTWTRFDHVPEFRTGRIFVNAHHEALAVQAMGAELPELRRRQAEVMAMPGEARVQAVT